MSWRRWKTHRTGAPRSRTEDSLVQIIQCCQAFKIMRSTPVGQDTTSDLWPLTPRCFRSENTHWVEMSQYFVGQLSVVCRFVHIKCLFSFCPRNIHIIHIGTAGLDHGVCTYCTYTYVHKSTALLYSHNRYKTYYTYKSTALLSVLIDELIFGFSADIQATPLSNGWPLTLRCVLFKCHGLRLIPTAHSLRTTALDSQRDPWPLGKPPSE